MRAEQGGEYRIELVFLVGAILAGGCFADKRQRAGNSEPNQKRRPGSEWR